MKRLVALLTFTVAFGFVFAAEFWDKKPYTEWSEKEAWSILDSSPWTGRVSVWGTAGPSTRVDINKGDRTDVRELRGPNSDLRKLAQIGSRESDTIVYLVRFQMADPVRRAWARLTLLGMEEDLGGSLQDLQGRQQVDRFVRTNPLENNIVVSVSTEDGRAPAALESATQEQLVEYTHLLLKKSKRKLGLEQYYAPARAGRMGFGNTGLFLFPRMEGDKELVTLA